MRLFKFLTDLLDEIALADLDLVRMAECGHNLPSSDESESLNAVKVCVFNSHDALVGEQLLGVVVDELPVDEHVDVVLADQINLQNAKIPSW